MMVHRRADAAVVTRKVQPGINVEERLSLIEEALHQSAKAASWAGIFHREWRRPLLVGVGLAVFQQITGINAIICYANQIFALVGFATEASRATVTTWAIGGVNVLATLIAIAFIDRLGRRKLLLAGLLSMGVAWSWLAPPSGSSRQVDRRRRGLSTAGIVTVAALVAFIVSFALSLGPVVWTVIIEIFPAHIRSPGVALATAIR